MRKRQYIFSKTNWGGLILIFVFISNCATQKQKGDESNWIYIKNCKYYTSIEYTNTFGTRPPDSLLLKNHPNFRLWSDSCDVLKKSNQ